jgi:hypothetical protein
MRIVFFSLVACFATAAGEPPLPPPIAARGPVTNGVVARYVAPKASGVVAVPSTVPYWVRYGTTNTFADKTLHHIWTVYPPAQGPK